MSPRQLTDAERAAFGLARLVAAETMPYFMHALCAVTPLAEPELGTFAVDGRWRLYMDPELLTGEGAWPPALAGAVLLHEIGHLLREHAERASALPQPFSPTAWNVAGDAEINDDLLAAGLALPEGAITPESLGCPPNLAAEDYYTALPSQDDEDERGCGSGAGGTPVPGENGVDPDLGVTPADADLIRRQVAEAVREAAGKGRGSAPAGLVRWADSTLAPPQLQWDRLLRIAIRRSVANKSGNTLHSWSRPPRRPLPGVRLPALRASTIIVTLVVDTSGSMSRDDLTASMSEVAGVLRSCGIDRDRLRILACDADATKPTPLRSITGVRLLGGGGTDMRVGIASALAARPVPHLVVVLTDGDTPWPDSPTRAHLVIGVIGNPDAGTPDWAHTVHIPVGASTPTPKARFADA
jgi:predicted metal-dependent peptidase